MRSLLFASIALASTAVAQSPVNYFEIYSGCTNYTSRGALGVNGGDNLLQIPASHFSGIGHDATGAGTVLTGFQYVMQDQNAATQEQYSLIIRADNAGAPDPTAAGLLLQTTTLTSPSGSGTLAWIVTVGLATPSTALPLCNTYYHGANTVAAPGWTADGLSWHICTYYNVNGTAASNPAPTNVPNIAWNIIAGAPTQPGGPRSIRYHLQLNAAVLNMANTDPTLIGVTTNCVSGLLNPAGNPRDSGVGGMWPENGGGRNDGLDCRIRDLASANGIWALFLGTNLGCPGLPLAGLANGALYLNPGGPFIQVASGGIDATGVGTAIVLPPGSAPGSIVNRFVDFQGFTIGSSLALPGNLTNRASVNYLP